MNLAFVKRNKIVVIVSAATLLFVASIVILFTTVNSKKLSKTEYKKELVTLETKVNDTLEEATYIIKDINDADAYDKLKKFEKKVNEVQPMLKDFQKLKVKSEAEELKTNTDKQVKSFSLMADLFGRNATKMMSNDDTKKIIVQTQNEMFYKELESFRTYVEKNK